MLVPGFLAGDGSLALLAGQLRGQGHRTYRSMIHADVGCSSDALDALERRVAAVTQAANNAFAQGYLLAEDRDALIAQAQASTVLQ